MSGKIPRRMSWVVIERWRALAERRRAHFLELYQSGRWKHYFDEQELITKTREANALAEIWRRLAAPPRACEALPEGTDGAPLKRRGHP